MESSFTETTNESKNTTSTTNNQNNERKIKKDYSFERIIKTGKEEGGKEINLSFLLLRIKFHLRIK